MISVREDSSIETPTPNMFSSRFGLTTLIVATDVMAIGFNQ